MTTLAFVVAGNPLPWQRVTGKGFHNDRRVEAYKRSVRLCAIAAKQRAKVAGVPWDVAARFTLTVVVFRATRQRFDTDRMLSTFCDAIAEKRDKAGRVIAQGLIYDDTAAHVVDVRLVVGDPVKASPRAVVHLLAWDPRVGHGEYAYNLSADLIGGETCA